MSAAIQIAADLLMIMVYSLSMFGFTRVSRDLSDEAT